jgi:hypothetical protein
MHAFNRVSISGRMEGLGRLSWRDVAMANGGERRVTCASCGKQIAAGVRYCIHCGAEQAVPTPIAAVAAALTARANEREAANAAHAESAPGAMARSAPPPPAHDVASSTPSARREAVAANAEPTQPMYASGPDRRGLATALIVCAALVAIALASAMIWRVEREPAATSIFETAGQSASDAAPATTISPSTPATPAGGEAPSDATSAPGAPGVLSSPGAGETTATTRSAEAPSASSPPVEIKSLPPRPALSRGTHAASAAKPPPNATPPASPAASAPTPAPVAPPQARPKVAAAGPGPSHVADRWQRLDEELSQCTRQDFITRVICAQRARFRYCEGYWGKVPACPGSPTPERGQ